MKEQVLKFFLISFLIFFFALLFAENAGYYTPRSSKVKTLTEEQIKIFEEDIKNGKKIDITEYTTNLKKDYTTSLSNNIYKTSLKLERFVDDTIKSIFKNVGYSLNKE